MSKIIPFRVQSHVLKLLGDELIGHDRLAIFELVKNAYDADATKVQVTLDLMSEPAEITVLDNGCGMRPDVIEHGWLEIGTDIKRGRRNRNRSPKFERMPLGEKGVGRLAVQKLGEKVGVTTRAEGEAEYQFFVDWDELIGSSTYLGDGLQVEVIRNASPRIFHDDTGTLIQIRGLHREEWTHREVRDLYRLVTSLSNPFEKVDSFQVELALPGREDEIADLPSVKDMLETAVWRFEFNLDETGKFSWHYKFIPPRFKGLEARDSEGDGKLELVPQDDDLVIESSENQEDIFLSAASLTGIGPISGRFYAFYRRGEILKESGSPALIKAWLDSQTGVRIYRDHVRVFNYGEPDDDWLGLNARRINRPKGKLGTQSVIAHIDLDLEKSPTLKEKTNREGFDDNETFRRLRRITLSIFDKLEREHAGDREKIDKALKGEASVPGIKVAMDKLADLAKRNKLEVEVKPLLKSIQNELDEFRELMVSSGMAGMNLALVFHEVVHSIDSIRRKLDNKSDPAAIRMEIDHLRKLLDTFKPLLQRERVRKLLVRDLVERAFNLHQDRFSRHGVVFSNWTADPKKSISFPITGPLSLLVGALSNVIDNAIYWVRYRQERDATKSPCAIVVLSSWDDERGGLIAVVDNGPGFQLPTDQVGTPFHSTRAGGMGLGLYYCKLVMESLGGRLEAMDAAQLRDEFDIPSGYDGAAIVFYFKGEK